MPKQTNLPACPVETALTLMGDRWKVLIVRDLLNGTITRQKLTSRKK